MTPTDKDLAEFGLLGLRYKLIRLSQFVAWGEEVLTQRDEPPSWAAEMAMAENEEDVISLLREMTGRCTPLFAINAFVGLLHRGWRLGVLSWRELFQPIWDFSDWGQESPHERIVFDHFWVGDFDLQVEFLMRGYEREEEVKSTLKEILTPFESLESLVPEWAMQP